VVNGFRSLTGILLVPARMFRVDIFAGPVHKKVRMYWKVGWHLGGFGSRFLSRRPVFL